MIRLNAFLCFGLFALFCSIVAATETKDSCAALLEGGSVAFVGLEEVRAMPEWQNAFIDRAKDRRYYEIVNQTINVDQLEYYYLVVRNQTGRVIAIQPSFVVKQDVLEAAGNRVKRFSQKVRTFYPNFLKIKILMIGNSAGPGQLQPINEEDRAETVRIFSKALVPAAKKLGVSLVVFKEFPREEYAAMRGLVTNGSFSVIPSLPRTIQDLSKFSSFDDYLSTQSSGGRRQIKKHLEASTGPDIAPITLEVHSSVGESIDSIYGLYRQTFDRATMSFEKLTPEFFNELSHRMPDRVRFFLWRQNGKIIAMQLCLVDGEAILTDYLGLDYSLAHDLKLYFRIHYDTVKWALANGYKTLVNTPLAYEPKRRFGQTLLPVDLYLAQTFSPKFDSLFRWIAPKMDPTFNEPELAKFSNFDEMAPPRSNR